jgi:hypothetical protein
MLQLIHIKEPLLQFGYGQAMEDPRDGLTLFGPLDQGKTYGVKAGLIGTKDGIEKFKEWAAWVQKPVMTVPPQLGRPPFPGFQTVYRIPWNPEPVVTLELKDGEIDKYVFLDDRHQRVYGTVGVYANALEAAIKEEEPKPELWFVVVPDRVWKYCRPKSIVEPEIRQQAVKAFKDAKAAKSFYSVRPLFQEMEDAATPYVYEEHFHNQLKARLLQHTVPIQIVKESTIANILKSDAPGAIAAEVARQSEIAWNLTTAIFYKTGGRPWKVANIRPGVCYVGLVFKQDETSGSTKNACCAAQMFLDSGDGLVFKGALGPWYSPETGDYHLNFDAAKQIGDLVLASYKKKFDAPPAELFIHGRVRLNDEEWSGFRAAVDSESRLVGVRIRDERNLKLYRKGQNPVLRGTAHIDNEKRAHLWTRGWTPRLQTYPGREVPNPIVIEVSKGDAPIETVVQDILSLTKLNYNACIFGDGMPITLKFADAIGEILTAAPLKDVPPLPFSNYI